MLNCKTETPHSNNNFRRPHIQTSHANSKHPLSETMREPLPLSIQPEPWPPQTVEPMTSTLAQDPNQHRLCVTHIRANKSQWWPKDLATDLSPLQAHVELAVIAVPHKRRTVTRRVCRAGSSYKGKQTTARTRTGNSIRPCKQ